MAKPTEAENASKETPTPFAVLPIELRAWLTACPDESAAVRTLVRASWTPVSGPAILIEAFFGTLLATPPIALEA